MTEIILLSKIYNSHQMKQIDLILSDLIGDLNVDLSIKGTLADRWVQLDLSGEDEAVATKLLEREVGFCPVSLDNVKKFAALKGYVVNLEESIEEISLDIGVVQPKTVYATIPLKHLQSHFAEGRKTTLNKINELWGICENLPLNIKVLDVNTEKNRVEAELQPTQIRKLVLWKDSLLDRLLVIGASLHEVNSAVEQEGLSRDVIEVESLGIFEHVLVCKLGTDAAGLIGRIGRRLRKAKFTVFNPKKIVSSQTTN
jgi:hypothetical protein